MTNEETDWDNLLTFDNDAENLNLFDFDTVPVDPVTGTDVELDSWMIGELEELLMKDDDADVINTNTDVSNENSIGDDFFEDLDLEISELIVEPSVSGAEVVNGENLSPLSENNCGRINNVNESSPNSELNFGDGKVLDDVVEVNDDDNDNGNDDDNDDGDDDDDPLAKKRKRQMRNRDAAMRSRERKKIRVKELEMKSRYFEEECRRLQRLLHCCYAENHWLRCSLQTYGAPLTRPESAVLLLESLLLGSLVWLMVNICLLPLPKLPLSNQDAAALASADRKVKLLETAAQRGKGTKTSELWITLPFTRSKRCISSRTKMRSPPAILCF